MGYGDAMSIETTKQKTFRVRLPIYGQREEIGIFNTEDEARDVQAAAKHKLASAFDAMTLGAWSETWLERCALSDRSRWRAGAWLHIPAWLLARRLDELAKGDFDRLWTHISKLASASPRSAEGDLLKPKTLDGTLSVLRNCLDAGVEAGHLRANPMPPFKERMKELRRAYLKNMGSDRTEAWTYLEPTEQRSIWSSKAIAEHHRLIILFAMLSGLRESEQNRIELSDILDLEGPNPRLRVDKSVNGLPPKNGLARDLPMSAELVRVVKRWLAVLADYLDGSKNEHGLVFPTRRGSRVPDSQHGLRTRKGRTAGLRVERERGLKVLLRGPMSAREIGAALWPNHSHVVAQRQARTKLVRMVRAGLVAAPRGVEGLVRYELTEPGRVALDRAKAPAQPAYEDLFATYMRAIGIVRNVRWHDLRHTAGSSLVSGWWGRRWTLEEVQRYLGHESIEATKRYAHLGETALKRAVRETPGLFVDDVTEVPAGTSPCPPVLETSSSIVLKYPELRGSSCRTRTCDPAVNSRQESDGDSSAYGDNGQRDGQRSVQELALWILTRASRSEEIPLDLSAELAALVASSGDDLREVAVRVLAGIAVGAPVTADLVVTLAGAIYERRALSSKAGAR